MPAVKSIPDICQRIAQVRQGLHGSRGKSSFAKQLGISPSTYNYYESARVPPAELLVRIADVGGVDLRWLLTGEVSAAPVPADHPAVVRIAKLLADHPDAAKPLTAFVELLSASLAWPEKPAAADGAAEPPKPASARRDHAAAAGRVQDEGPPPGPASAAGVGGAGSTPTEDWIPILGRSAAGVPCFWSDREESAGVTLLADLVRRHARRARRRVSPAVADETVSHALVPVQIVTLSEPDDRNVAEFVAAGELKRRYPDAFGVRVDGDSMSPEIRHGDIVICSASVPAAEGAPAVVQLAGQIGVTCKILRRQGDSAHLVPINEQYPPQAFPADQVVWARRVLARVRAQ